jgi:hypothetical protein
MTQGEVHTCDMVTQGGKGNVLEPTKTIASMDRQTTRFQYAYLPTTLLQGYNNMCNETQMPHMKQNSKVVIVI